MSNFIYREYSQTYYDRYIDVKMSNFNVRLYSTRGYLPEDGQLLVETRVSNVTEFETCA
jgi:hypothetical protein